MPLNSKTWSLSWPLSVGRPAVQFKELLGEGSSSEVPAAAPETKEIRESVPWRTECLRVAQGRLRGSLALSVAAGSISPSLKNKEFFFLNKNVIHTSVIPAQGRQRQEDCQIQSLPGLQNTTKQKQKQHRYKQSVAFCFKDEE